MILDRYGQPFVDDGASHRVRALQMRQAFEDKSIERYMSGRFSPETRRVVRVALVVNGVFLIIFLVSVAVSVIL